MSGSPLTYHINSILQYVKGQYLALVHKHDTIEIKDNLRLTVSTDVERRKEGQDCSSRMIANMN